MTEPEEIIESRIVAQIVGAKPDVPVLGALAPSQPGTEKVAPDSHVSVSVDLAGQGLDWKGPGIPCDYSVSIAVRVAESDDPTGELFRAVCRTVRAALDALLGDGCSTLDGDGFFCDAFVLSGTQTARMAFGDFTQFVKAYTATLTGRFIPQQETKQEEQNG